MFSTKGYSFQSSLVYELNRIGAQFIEYPITFNERKIGHSKLSLADQIEFLLNLIKINIIHKKEFIKYSLVGLSGAIINVLAYIFFSRYLSIETSLASLFSMEISILSNFSLNNFWTFNSRPKNLSFGRKVISFHLIASINGLIFYYLLFLFLQNMLGINDIVSIIISIFSGTLSNYILNSHWTWKFK